MWREIHLAGRQPFDQFFRREVDQFDLVRPFEHRVGQRLLHDHASDLRDHVVQTLDVLHVERCVHVDACVEQLFDILPAFRVPQTFRVRVSQFIHEQQLRLASECRVEIELAERHSAIRHLPKRQRFEPLQQRLSFRTPVRLDVADDDLDALSLLAPRGFEHCKRLAHSGRVPEEHLQPTTLRSALIRLYARQ